MTFMSFFDFYVFVEFLEFSEISSWYRGPRASQEGGSEALGPLNQDENSDNSKKSTPGSPWEAPRRP